MGILYADTERRRSEHKPWNTPGVGVLLRTECPSILSKALIPSTRAAHQIRSVYAIGINVIFLTVFLV